MKCWVNCFSNPGFFRRISCQVVLCISLAAQESVLTREQHIASLVLQEQNLIFKAVVVVPVLVINTLPSGLNCLISDLPC